MRHESHSDAARVPIDAGRQIAQLRHVLQLVEELCGRSPDADPSDAALDEAALISTFYYQAEPIVQRRFDTLARETTAWSAAGVEALLAAGGGRSPAAVRRLADEIRQALSDLGKLLRPAAAPEAASAIPSP